MKNAILLLVAVTLAWWILVGNPFADKQPTLVEDPGGGEGGPSFQLRVLVPRLALPFAGILPNVVATYFDLTPSELVFDHQSPGAEWGYIGPDRLELRNAEGWDFSLVTDVEGALTSKTRLIFPLGLGGTRRTLRCRPEANAVGHLQSAPMSGQRLEGRFLVELAHCEDAVTGERVPWPASPLTVRGSFERLTRRPQ